MEARWARLGLWKYSLQIDRSVHASKWCDSVRLRMPSSWPPTFEPLTDNNYEEALRAARLAGVARTMQGELASMGQ
jgi:hypothetical protein